MPNPAPCYSKWNHQPNAFGDPSEGTVQKFMFPGQAREWEQKSEQDRTSVRMKGWAARLPHRFFSAEWITDTYFQLRVEFLKFGLGGKRCLWQSPVWFWWELATNPTLYTHRHVCTNISVLTFRLIHRANSSRRSRDRYPSLHSFAEARDADVGVFSSPVH